MEININATIHVHHHGDVAGVQCKLDKIITQGERIMSKISEYAVKQTEFNQTVGDKIDEIGVSLTGITGDIAGLNQKITDLQNNPGPISPEDQATLDSLQAAGLALATKAGAAAKALADLDAMTPPVVPPTP